LVTEKETTTIIKTMFNPSSTETKIALLEERINVYEQMMERIDTAIQKIGETSQNISQMLAVHNEKIEQCNRTDNIIVKMIEDIKESSKAQHEAISRELGERIEKLEEKVETISQFKWKAVGAIAIVAFLVGVIPTATSLLTRTPSQVTIEQAK
jgi:chromosome segregation ATPase